MNDADLKTVFLVLVIVVVIVVFLISLTAVKPEKKTCLECKNEFRKPYFKSGNMGLLWLVFIFLSMGLGVILYFLIGRSKKAVCPYCGSDKFVKSINYKG